MIAATMICLFIGMCLSQALSVGWVARHENRDGLPVWAVALGIHALAYLLFFLHENVSDFVFIVAANALISVAYALYLRAVGVFLGRMSHNAALFLPPVLQAIACMLLLDNLRGRVIFCTAILLIQCVLIAIPLCRHPFAYPSRGRNLMVFALSLVIVADVVRIGGALWSADVARSIFQPGPILLGTYAFAFFAVIFVTDGFVLMAKERSDHALRNAAMTDRLTGLWNRIRIEEFAQQELARLQRYGHPIALMMIDIDHFKQVNDRYGHVVGDEVLRRFAQLVQTNIRSTDVAGRWGGEEFVVVLPSCSIGDVIPLAERLRVALQDYKFSNGLSVTASFGVAPARSIDTWNAWFDRADAALYAAKNAGRNRLQVEGMTLDLQVQQAVGGVHHHLLWSPQYEIGDADIDAEHRSIFAAANELLSMGAHPTSREAFLAKAEPLLQVVETHFSHEEQRLLAADNRAAGLAHRDIHRYLVDRAHVLLDQFRGGEVGEAALFHFIIFEYIVQHILIEDRQIAPLLASAALSAGENAVGAEGTRALSARG